MLINTNLIASIKNRRMMKDTRLVMVMKVTIVMILALFTLSHTAHAQGRIPTPKESNSGVSRMFSAKPPVDITGKGCAAGFNAMYNSTPVFDLLSSIVESCGNSWAVDYHMLGFTDGEGVPIKPLLLICEKTGGLGRVFFQPDLGAVFECYYKN